MVGTVRASGSCHWDEPTKLVNLVTRLKGQAFAFYRSCNTNRRNQYTTLVEDLRKRFTPVGFKLFKVASSMTGKCGYLRPRIEGSLLPGLSASHFGDTGYGETCSH